MKRLIRQSFSALLSFALACQLYPAALASSPDVPITEDMFPDALFRQWLTDPANLDGAGADGVFTQEELADIRQIDVSSMGISSLEGIEVFSALESLDCKDNALTELDVQQNPAPCVICSAITTASPVWTYPAWTSCGPSTAKTTT